ncbi:MAG: hypothetical protein EB060_00720 [Proteobacteria bacterium]|nr:hypothetical protein [Pseudomonadota bacterium]
MVTIHMFTAELAALEHGQTVTKGSVTISLENVPNTTTIKLNEQQFADLTLSTNVEVAGYKLIAPDKKKAPHDPIIGKMLPAQGEPMDNPPIDGAGNPGWL